VIGAFIYDNGTIITLWTSGVCLGKMLVLRVFCGYVTLAPGKYYNISSWIYQTLLKQSLHVNGKGIPYYFTYKPICCFRDLPNPRILLSCQVWLISCYILLNILFYNQILFLWWFISYRLCGGVLSKEIRPKTIFSCRSLT
jgi:hypothetical protein